MKKLFGMLSTLALLVVIALTALLVGVRLIGLTPYSVLSGSMEPAYSVGDLIYVKEIPLEEIEVGMPITYVANEQLIVATHRVTGVHVRTTKTELITDEEGRYLFGKDGQPLTREIPLDEPTYYFETRGDANPDADPAAVYGPNVIGTPVYAVPYLGHFVTILQSTAGKVMAGCFALMLVILMFLPEMLQAIEKHEKKAKPQDGEDTLVCDADAPKGDDVLTQDENAADGEDRLIDAPGQQ